MNHNTADRLEEFVEAVTHALERVQFESYAGSAAMTLVNDVKDKSEALRCAIRADVTILRTR